MKFQDENDNVITAKVDSEAAPDYYVDSYILKSSTSISVDGTNEKLQLPNAIKTKHKEKMSIFTHKRHTSTIMY